MSMILRDREKWVFASTGVRRKRVGLECTHASNFPNETSIFSNPASCVERYFHAAKKMRIWRSTLELAI